MADGQNNSNSSQPDLTPSTEPFPDIKKDADAIAQKRQQIDAIPVEIQGQNTIATTSAIEIDRIRLDMEKTQAKFHEQLAAMQNAVAALNPQLEAARAASAELTTLNANMQAANAASTAMAAQAVAVIESAKQMASTAAETIGRIEAIRDDAVKTQATIAERNAWIESGREHVAKFLREIEGSLDGARRSAATAEVFLASSKASSDSTEALRAAAQATKERVDVDAQAASVARAAIDGHAAVTSRIADIAADAETRVAKYEAALNAMQEVNRQQAARVDEILSGATDGSLGGAYRKRGEGFKRPAFIWHFVFFLALAGLLVLAGWQAAALKDLQRPPEWEELSRMMLMKLPFLIPLIWLAVHAARQAAFAKRMEEEYAFKATTSFSFEGYRRQMAEVGKDLDPGSPLAQLCNNTLRTIAAPPGKIYDKQRMDPTPGTVTAEFVAPVVDGASKRLGVSLPDLKP